jgi:hypothetical protein
MTTCLRMCRRLVAVAGAVSALAPWTGMLHAPKVHAQGRIQMRVSSPAVPDDWHARMWTVLKDELEKSAPPGEGFGQQGLRVDTPDVEAFRKVVQQAYLNSEYAKAWPAGLLDRINATR